MQVDTINFLLDSALNSCKYEIGDIYLDMQVVEALISGINSFCDADLKLRLFSNFAESELDKFPVSNYVKVFIAGYIEYIYRLNKVKVPSWVMSKKYRLLGISENPDFFILKPSSNSRAVQNGFQHVLKHKLDESIPEFRWRKLIMESL